MEWIKFKDKKPELNQEISGKYIIHRFGVAEETGESTGVFLGMNPVINRPMVDTGLDDDGGCYLEFVYWKPIKNNH